MAKLTSLSLFNLISAWLRFCTGPRENCPFVHAPLSQLPRWDLWASVQVRVVSFFDLVSDVISLLFNPSMINCLMHATVSRY